MSVSPRISFAQNGEDVVLDRAFQARERGFYIDVGAADPRADNVTRIFYERGWYGVNVEPQRAHFDDLVVDRPRDVNLHAGVSDEPGELTLYRVPEIPGWSTMNPEFAQRYRNDGFEVVEERIPVLTLTQICEQHAPDQIDILKIDVEGHEAQALKGMDFGRFRPTVVVIEATNPHEWEHAFEASGYEMVLWDGVNRFYLAPGNEHLEPMLRSPANVLDSYERYDLHDRTVVLVDRVEALDRDLQGERQYSAALAQQVRDLELRLNRHPYRHAIGWTRAKVTDLLRNFGRR